MPAPPIPRCGHPVTVGWAEAPAGQLNRAREVFTACSGRLDNGPTGLPADFERMRWFPLPPVRLEQTRTGTG
ncbi:MULTISPECIES: hypothetical protein [unclassified Streptomyces]|uniref:hypothetical protein n=1 Tax=unclassified Streptomyces TaxID=2593676 RepID=UPI002E2736E8